MRNIVKDIEQLEVAGDLIDKDTPTTSRLALFLIDNFAELIMYRIALYKFARDDQWKTMRPSKYPFKNREDIKNHFDSKLNCILNDLKLIEQSDASVFRVGHKLRNEAYHNGILREIIITPVTRTYFKTICSIFQKLWVGSSVLHTYSTANELKDFLMKYGIEADILTHHALGQICQRILNGRDITVVKLAKAISDDLATRIQDTLDIIHELSSGPAAMSPDEGLKWLQFREEGGMEFGQTKNDEEFRLFWEEVRTKLASFKPKVTSNTLNNWIKKANTIKTEKDKGNILQKYWTIDKQFINIESMVREELFRYEEEIP
ncbi:MAG: hypothetical protein KKD99_06590 [Proteobacteria bacterium]|nr:hypothetical protein [Pseudomonadota bacterium]